MPVWYLSDKKWRYGFKRYEEVPVWDTVPLSARTGMTILPLILHQQEGQHPLTGQRAANFRLLANQ